MSPFAHSGHAACSLSSLHLEPVRKMRALAVVCLAAVSGCLSATSGPPSFARVETNAPPLSDVSESVALRQKYALPIPENEPFIFVESVGIHHTRQIFSTIASRDHSGMWTVSVVGEESSGLLTMEPTLIPEVRRTLTPQEGRVLDRLMASRNLYSLPLSYGHGQIGVGSPEHTMEIAAGGRRLVVHWNGKLRGPAGQIADIVIGAA